MLAAQPALARRPEPEARALAAAVRATALSRLTAPEREWARRVERRRLEVIGLAGERTSDELGVWDLERAVRWMSVPPVLGRLLLRTVRELCARTCLELGTGFGLSTAYLAAGLELNGEGRLVSLDVAPGPAGIAREGLATLALARAEVRVGKPGAELPATLAELGPLDLVFVDADHRRAATLATFERLLPNLSPGAVLVFDDVGASWGEMPAAWDAIAADPRIAWRARLGRLGVVGARGRSEPVSR